MVQLKNTISNIQNVQNIAMNSKSISNLEGMQCMINARILHLAGNSITNIAPLRNMSLLTPLRAEGNNVSNLQRLLGSGFATLGNDSTFTGQSVTLDFGTSDLMRSPVRLSDDTIVPITETATVKRSNADGTLNPNGTYMKLFNTYNSGTVNAAWSAPFLGGDRQ